MGMGSTLIDSSHIFFSLQLCGLLVILFQCLVCVFDGALGLPDPFSQLGQLAPACCHLSLKSGHLIVKVEFELLSAVLIFALLRLLSRFGSCFGVAKMSFDNYNNK